ncbi:MAG TPA: F0F1 ATP synthase subunit B [Gemmatimonadales bacterium]|nr:F0F1 ATP synthase subunit B [Gemmatimonadales bacterium]
MTKSLWLVPFALALATPLPAAQGEHGGGGPLTVEGGLMFWTIVVFLLLLSILRKFAWPQILGAVEARERALEEQLAAAERNRAESARLLEEHRKLVADARTEAQALIAQARALAEKERAAILEQARKEQEELLERTRKEIAVERERAVQELRREAVDLSLAAAAKLIGQRLDGEADRKLVVSYLSSLEAQH